MKIDRRQSKKNNKMAVKKIENIVIETQNKRIINFFCENILNIYIYIFLYLNSR